MTYSKAAAIYVREQFGSLDILVNNGGINRSSVPNATLRETYRAVFETNVFGVAVVIDAYFLFSVLPSILIGAPST